MRLQLPSLEKARIGTEGSQQFTLLHSAATKKATSWIIIIKEKKKNTKEKKIITRAGCFALPSQTNGMLPLPSSRAHNQQVRQEQTIVGVERERGRCREGVGGGSAWESRAPIYVCVLLDPRGQRSVRRAARVRTTTENCSHSRLRRACAGHAQWEKNNPPSPPPRLLPCSFSTSNCQGER